MADEKKPKKQRVEEVSSSSSSTMIRTLVDAMTDEDDKKTRELGNALPGSILVRLLLGPSTIIYNMLLHHEQRRLLQAVQGKKAVAILQAYRSRTFVLDHEWRRSFPRQAGDHDLSEAAKWLPNEHQRAVLQKLVIRDVWDLLEQHQGEQLLASLAPLVRELVVQQTVETGNIRDKLPLETICSTSLRRIRVDQAGPYQGHWSLGRFVKWMRAEKQRSPAFELERFSWNQLHDEIYFEGWEPLLSEWATWKRRPTHLTLSVVSFLEGLVSSIVDSLPELQSLRLRVNFEEEDAAKLLVMLQKLPLTDLQLLSNRHCTMDRTAMTAAVAAFSRIQQLTITPIYLTGDPHPPDALATLTELRHFGGPVELLPAAATAWPRIEGLSIQAFFAMKKGEVEQLIRFLNARHRWKWVDICGLIGTDELNLLAEHVPNCPWRFLDISPPETSKGRELKWVLQPSTIDVRLWYFPIPDKWIEQWFPRGKDVRSTSDPEVERTRTRLRILKLNTGWIPLSSSTMTQLARAAPYLEYLSLNLSAIHIGDGEDIKTWCKHLAEWPRRFPRLKCMEVAVTSSPAIVSRDWFAALDGTDNSQLPFVRFQFPVVGDDRSSPAVTAGNAHFYKELIHESDLKWLDEYETNDS
jgi:hypothetical protein